MVAKIGQIEFKPTVWLQIHQLAHGIHVVWCTIGCQAHDLILAGIHFEAQVVGERGVEEPERMRKMNLAQHLERIAVTDADRGGGPFADPIHGEDHRLLERRGEEG